MWLISVLVVLWIILSGYFSFLPLLPGLIFIGLGFLLFKKAKKDAHFNESFSLKPTKFLLYIPYLTKEIYMSNIYVAKMILKNQIKPQVFSITNTFKTQSGTTTFANSVTLTPGTIVVNADDKNFIIHALTQETKDGVLAYDMYNKVLHLEKPKSEKQKSKKNLSNIIEGDK